MKKIIFASLASLAFLTACEDYNDQFNLDSSITDVKNSAFTLADSDYGTVANLAANQELALSKDPETGSFVEALNKVGSDKYFTTLAPAEDYLPAFINNQYPEADNGSRFVVTANVYKEPSGYLADFKNISVYNLSSADYETVWGDYIKASFLSPASLSKIPVLLGANVTGAQDGDMKVVNYAYSETEPSTGGGTAIPVVYQLVDEFEEGANYVIAAKGQDGNYYPFGKLQKESYNYGYMYPEAITVTDGIISGDDGAEQMMIVEKTADGYALKNAWGQYLYMSGTFDSFNVTTSLPTEGGSWLFNANGDGTFAIQNVEKEKTVKLTLYNGSYSYGSYAASKYETKEYLSAIGTESDGSFTPVDVALPEGSTYVWKFDSKYGYWKGSAYVGGNKPAESWLISPAIDLADAKVPELTFDAACRYFNGTPESYMTVWISEDYAGDVATATWTELEVNNWSDGNSWDFYNSGAMDLSAYKGKTVYVAFKYKSTAEAAPTWEIKNVKVKEQSLYWDVCLFKEVAADGSTAVTRMVTTRADIQANASALYVYNNNNWQLYSNSDAKVAVVDPSVYASLGSDVIADPETVIPIYLSKTYPYAVEGDRVAVVYNESADKTVVAEYTFQAGWAASLDYEPITITFVKENGLFSAQMSTYIDETFLGSEGGFTVQNVNLGGLNYVWQNTSTYGWKASAYYNNTNNVAESWLISPAVNFKKAVVPEMIFDEAHRYLNNAPLEDYMKVKISSNYKGDVTTCDWTTLTVTGWSDGQTWDFVTIDAIDLSEFVGQTVYIAFQYNSDATAAPTWEIMNLKVRERESENAE